MILTPSPASGFGLAVAKRLVAKGWKISIAEMNASTGRAAAVSIPATFHQTNVANYESLSKAFHQTFKEHGRIDFVFANAGIVERDNFYAELDGEGPPPEFDQSVVDIDLNAVISTTWLARFYMRKNPDKTGGCIVSTSSVGGIYATPFCPLYTAAKHGVVGLNRSIAGQFWKNDKIRVNTLMPAVSKTSLMSEKEWSTFEGQTWTPIEKVVDVVDMLVNENADNGEAHWGKSVEVVGPNHYFRDQVEFSCEAMRKIIVQTERETV